MFPELPTCSPFANKIPCFKPGLSWNALPWSSDSVYPEITTLTAQRATEEILHVFSPDTHFNCSLSLCTSAAMYFSLHLSVKKTLFLQEVTFSHIMSQTPFLGYMMPHAKQEPRCEPKGSSLSKGRRILTYEYCFYCNATGQEKWHRTANGDREGGAGTDCLPVVASWKLECHLHWITSGRVSLMPPEINLLNHFWCIRTIHTDSFWENKEKKTEDIRICCEVFNFQWVIAPQLNVCCTVKSCYQKARRIVSQYFVCRWCKKLAV